MEQSKSGVYVCDCGVNIAATINVPVVVKLALQTPVK
jgi:heterodisulfide reductase subunit A-like polyferredoxin